MMTTYLSVQTDYIYFFYGLAFGVLALAALALKRVKGQALPWKWLSLFGFVCCLNEWFGVLVPSLGDSSALPWLRTVSNVIMFFFLFEFARSGAPVVAGRRIGSWIYFPIFALLIFGLNLDGRIGLFALCRYSLGLFGGLWSAWVLWRSGQLERDSRKRSLLTLASASLCFHSLAVGLVVPKAGFFPASVMNSAAFEAMFVFPIQIPRGILALLLAWAIWKYYRVLRRESLVESDLEFGDRYERLCALGLVLVIVAGWVVTDTVGKLRAGFMQNEVLKRTEIAAATISLESVKTLKWDDSDLLLPGYQLTKRLVSQVHQSNSDCRFVALLGIRGDQVHFLMDSEPPESKDYSSPGQIYQEADPQLKRGIDRKKSFVIGPVTDRWGTWVIGAVPLLNLGPESDPVSLAFAIDASNWKTIVAHSRLFSILVTMVFSGLLMIFLAVQQNLRQKSARIEISEQRFRTIFDSVNDSIFINDLETGAILDTNLKASEMHGWTREEFRNLTIEDLSSKEPHYTQSDAIAWIAKAASGTPQVFEWRAKHRSGSLFWVEVNMRMASIDGRNRLLVTVRDITERKRAEDALRNSEARYRTLVENTSIGVLQDNVEGDAVYINPALCGMLGITDTKEIDRLGWRAFFSAESLERIEKENIKRAQGQTSIYEVELVDKKGGRKIAVVHGAPLISEEGQFQGTIATFLDITDRKRAEEALRESEEALSIIFEESPFVVVLSDAETGRLIRVNKAFCVMSGNSEQEALEGLPHDLFLVSDPETRRKLEDNLRRDGYLSYEEAPFVDSDGGVRFGLLSSRIIQYRGRSCVLTAWLDITDRKRIEEDRTRLEDQLRQAQKMESIGRLAGGIAHDFNNLLTAILGNVDLAMLDVDSKDPVHAKMSTIGKAAQSASILTRQLLAFSRKQIIEPKIFDLNGVLDNMHRMLERLIGEDITLVTLPAEDLGIIKADRNQIEQMILNLAINARDAMPEGGRLTLETKNATLDEAYCLRHVEAKPGQYILLSVSDTGCGMTEEVKRHLFEPFFTTKDMGKGTGLGLATVYGALKQNNGLIDVYSEPGKGSVFKLYFPRLTSDAEMVKKPLPLPGEIPKGTETVLLVEDQSMVRELIQMLLDELGYSVLSCAFPKEAIEVSRKHSGTIHLLMTDVVMPEMNGRELALQITNQRPSIRVLFTSGYTEDAIVHQGILDEGLHFIGKPFSMVSLAVKLRETLEA